MQLHQLQPKTKRVTKKRVGRGGKRGKTAGRGTKGQKARAGHRIRPEVRDTIKKLPKLRGRGIHPNKPVTQKPVVVSLSMLENAFTAGDAVTPRALMEKRVVRSRGNRPPSVKILGTGALTKKLAIVDCSVSESARRQIDAVGGTIS